MITLDEAITHAKEVAEEKRVEATAIATGKEDYFFALHRKRGRVNERIRSF